MPQGFTNIKKIKASATSTHSVNFLRENWEKKPLSHLADKLKLQPVDVTTLLRKHQITYVAFAVDHIFIGENLRTRRLTSDEVVEKLHLTKTQYKQIVNRKHGGRLTGNSELVNPDMAVTSTRYLLENKLQLEIDAELPKLPLCKELQKQNHAIYQWAREKAEKDPEYKFFGPTAYLICLSYPEKFRPFNFRGSKGRGGKGTNKSDYFSGSEGRKRFIEACLWIISKEIGLKYEDLLREENKQTISDAFFNRPLNSRTRQFYGLNARMQGKLFKNEGELVGEILRYLQVSKPPNRLCTRKLREILNKEEINPNKCFVPHCNHSDNVEIHHLVPVSRSHIYKDFDYDTFINLIPLCPNHHKIIQRCELSPGDLLLDKTLLIKTLMKKRSQSEIGDLPRHELPLMQ